MRTVIIEDEQPAARRLERLLLEVAPTVDVCFRADSIEDSVAYFNAGPSVDLVFMDIQLADGLSFSIFEQCTVPAPVIFTTAFDHYAVKAFRVNGLDYLLKPIDPSELRSALEKFRNLPVREKEADLRWLAEAMRSKQVNYRQRFLVRSGSRLAFIPVEDIAYFFSEEGTTFLVTKSNERLIIDLTLEQLEDQLDPTCYFRISRKMIVCVRSIRRIEPHYSNRLILEVEPPFGDEVTVSRQRSAEFRSWLDR